MPERKSLLCPNCHFFLGCLQNPGPEPAVLVEESPEVQSMAEAEWVADRSSQFAHLAIEPERLVGVAEVPQGQGEIAAVRHAGVVTGISSPELRLFAILVAGQCLFEVGAGARELPTVEHRNARHEERFHQHAGVVQPLRQLHSFGSEVHAHPQVGAHDPPLPYAQHDPEQLPRIIDPPAQFRARCRIGPTSGAAYPRAAM